jgi:DNA-binding IclR family transcriptional regulator
VAWLSRLTDDDALRLAARQAYDARHPAGHNAPTSLAEVQERIRAAREKGWARVHDSVEEGISAMAAPLVDPDSGAPLGVVSIAGPSLQLFDERMEALAPRLLETAAELSGLAGSLSQELRSRNGFGAAG